MAGRDDQLDFFIMASSIPEQSAQQLRAIFAPPITSSITSHRKIQAQSRIFCTSIGLGMISKVHYLHEHPKIEAFLLRKGIYPLNEEDILGFFDIVLSKAQSSGDDGNYYAGAHLLTGFETTAL